MFITILIMYFIVINISTFAAFAADKRKARRDGWRVKESTLLLLSFLGGAIGGILGMILCRHKIRSLKFKIFLPVFLIVQIIIVGTTIYINDYYHAEEAAYVSIQQPVDGVSVAELENGTWAFSPETPHAGIIFYPGGKVEAESYAPLMEAFAEKGFLTVLVSMPGNLAVLDQDQVLDMEAYEYNRKNLPADFQEVIIEGGCHAYFGTYGMQEGDGKPAVTQQEQVRQTADAVAGLIGNR